MTRQIDLILLMGPPGSGKSTLGNELNRQGIAVYTDLEPLLVRRYGSGEKFAQQRPMIHEWIHNFYRQQLNKALLPVVIETTGIGDRSFLKELCAQYQGLFIKLDTQRRQCVARVVARTKGQHVTDHSDAAAEEFFDNWHSEIAPNYEFALTVTGTNLESDVREIRKALGVIKCQGKNTE